MSLASCLRVVAPYYNLVLVIIVIGLFIHLFKNPSKKTFIKPWQLLFTAVLVYVVEQILAVLDIAGAISVPTITFPLIEMVIISLFIYVVLLEKENLKSGKKKTK